MLRFLGTDIELAVDAVLDRRGGPALCAAHDSHGNGWLIVRLDDDPSHLVWACAPASCLAIQAVTRNPQASWGVVRHSLTGTVEVVVVDHGRSVPDRCVLGSSFSPGAPIATPRYSDLAA